MLSDFSTKGTSALVDVEEYFGVDFSTVVAVWMPCSLDSHAHVLNHDGTAFAEQRRSLGGVLYRENAATIYQGMQRYNFVVNKT